MDRLDLIGWPDDIRILNTYGPAECTPTSVMRLRCQEGNEPTSIGFGAGAVTWVADTATGTRLAPIGAVGELLLEGPIVGQGYLNDPEKTAAAFIEDPPWLVRGGGGHPGRRGRLYKTGDLVRYNEDGSLVYVGRKDTQVKIRGQRVELGEVEHHLRACEPGARQVAAEVIMPAGEGASAMLAAFLVLEDRQRHDGPIRVVHVSAAVDDALTDRLPAYMVPAVFFSIPELPLNSSGKTDRRRLRDLGSAFSAVQLAALRSAAPGDKKAPSTAAELALQQIWARVLNLEPSSIGVDDSFFRLGGDSITAMQVSAAARASLGNISTVDILRSKTISGLTSHLHSSFHRSTLRMSSEDDYLDRSFPLSPIQHLYTHLQSHPNQHIFDQGFFLKLRTPVSYESIVDAFTTITERHAMLRARFRRTTDGLWEQRLVKDVPNSFFIQLAEGFNHIAASQAEAIRRCREMLDIERGPLLTAIVFDSEGSQSLFVSAHHLVIDLVSWRILLQDLEDLLTSKTVSVPLSLSFQAWCNLQAKYAAENLDSGESVLYQLQPPLLSYWGIDSYTNVQGATVVKQFALDETITKAVLGKSNEAFGTRPVELMLAALAYSFALTFSDRPVPIVFSEGHGREAWDDHIDISRTVGWFTTMFPINTSFDLGANLFDVIKNVKDTMRCLPANGWSYFASRFADRERTRVHSLSFPVEISFNYAGQYQQLERAGAFFEEIPMPEESSPESAAGLQRFAIFDVLARMVNGQLTMSMIYHRGSKHQERIETWVKQYQDTLIQLATLLPERQPEWTLVDFPMAFDSYTDLDGFYHRFLPSIQGVQACDIENVYPCTPVQEGMLVAQAKDQRNYRTALEFELFITHPYDLVDLPRIKQAWQAVMKRHSLLRALLVTGVPGSHGTMHIILKEPKPDISFVRTDEDTTAIALLLDGTRPARYQQDGLQHHLLVRQIDDKHAVLRLEINHVILDGHSTKILLRDFQAAYSGDLDPVGPSYSEFVQYVRGRSQKESHAYWMKYLDGIKPCLFPTSGSRRKGGHNYTVDVPGLDREKIHAFCAEWDLTIATVIRTAWALVLFQFTGLATPCFGTVASGRDVSIPDVQHLLGPLICLMPCRISFDHTSPVLEVLRDVHKDYIASLPYQTYPSMDARNLLNLQNPSLFNTALSFQRGEKEAARPSTGHSFLFQGGVDPVEWDIYVRAVDDGAELLIHLEFWDGQVARSVASRVANFFGIAVYSIISNSQQPSDSLLNQGID